MVSEVIIPVMDQTTETVLLTRWLKKEGDAVRKGDAICEIETDKATAEIEAEADGLLRKTLIEAGTQIPTRTVIALIALADDPLPDIDPYHHTSSAKPSAPSPSSPRTRGQASTVAPAYAGMEQAVASPTPTPSPTKEIKISPRARRLAEEHGIDPATINGTGPEGRIVEDDVRSAIAIERERTAQAGTDAASRVAQAKAERVSLSWRTIPHFYMSITVDLSRIVNRKSAGSDRMTYTDFFAQAIAQTLAQHPMLNGHWQNDSLMTIPEIRLGLVVQTERGLVIPAMRDLRGRSLEDIAAEREQLVQQAHAGKLSAAAMVEPTFTLSNVGPGHIDAFTAIISPPQVAILSVGSILHRPLVVSSELALRPTATFTLSVDHRAIDGQQAAAFLEQLKTNLES